MPNKIDFATFNKPIVANGWITSLQSTTSTSGVNVNQLSDGTNPANMQITLNKSATIVVGATFPISTSASNASVDMYVNDTLVSQIVTNQETTSHSTTGFLKVDLQAGVHKFTFKLRASSGQTAYIGAYREISIAIVPVMG